MAHCLFPLSIWLADEENWKTKNYLERQKVRKLRSNISPFHQISSWKVKGRRKKPPSFQRDIRKTWHNLRQSAPVSGSMKYHEKLQSLQEIRFTSSDQLWGSNRELTTVPLACRTRSPTSLIYPWGCPTNHFASVVVFASRKYTTFFVRWSWFCSTSLKISCSIR